MSKEKYDPKEALRLYEEARQEIYFGLAEFFDLNKFCAF